MGKNIISIPDTPKRSVLLLEPNYNNKYPPMGLMKLATYFRTRGDDVRFFKGDLKDLAAELLFEEVWNTYGNASLVESAQSMRDYIRTGKRQHLNDTISANSDLAAALVSARQRYEAGNYPQFDFIGVTTLFTFKWKKTIATINGAKNFLKPNGRIMVGGVASTILADKFEAATGIKPWTNSRGGALMDEPGAIDSDDTRNIDTLPLDYSLLDETNYVYPAEKDETAYYGYMTRGCIRKCDFCAVHRLEPTFCGFIGLKDHIEYTDLMFGRRRNLLLLDNNAFASRRFDEIIDEIKDCGFGKGDLFIPSNEYEIAINNIRRGYNVRTYLKKAVCCYGDVVKKLPKNEQDSFAQDLVHRGLTSPLTATVDAVLGFDDTFAKLYNKYVYSRLSKRGRRIVDFNQGVDARLMTDEKAQKLSEISINPLRIAFDHWEKDPKNPNAPQPFHVVYEKAVRLAAKHGIKDFSNYLLYNTDDDTPAELYRRMQLNTRLQAELGIRMFSFPMKFQPLDNPEYSDNRAFIGSHWNKQYIRAVQCVLKATLGKVGHKRDYFDFSFGQNLDAFKKILLMPETLIIERHRYDKEAHKLFETTGKKSKISAEVLARDGETVSRWWNALNALSLEQRLIAESKIFNYDFSDEGLDSVDADVRAVLEFYRIKYGTDPKGGVARG